MLEIYNEECKDLLGKGTANLAGPGGSKRPPVAHDERGQTTVAGVDVFDVRCEERLKALMARAAGALLPTLLSVLLLTRVVMTGRAWQVWLPHQTSLHRQGPARADDTIEQPLSCWP